MMFWHSKAALGIAVLTLTGWGGEEQASIPERVRRGDKAIGPSRSPRPPARGRAGTARWRAVGWGRGGGVRPGDLGVGVPFLNHASGQQDVLETVILRQTQHGIQRPGVLALIPGYRADQQMGGHFREEGGHRPANVLCVATLPAGPRVLCGEGGAPRAVRGTCSWTESVVIQRHQRDIAGPVEPLAKGLMSDERMVDRDNQHVVSVGSFEGRGYTGKWPMSMNGVWPGFPPVSIGAEKNGSVGNRPQCRPNHFEHRLVAHEDICLVLSHAGAHAAR